MQMRSGRANQRKAVLGMRSRSEVVAFGQGRALVGKVVANLAAAPNKSRLCRLPWLVDEAHKSRRSNPMVLSGWWTNAPMLCGHAEYVLQDGSGLDGHRHSNAPYSGGMGLRRAAVYSRPFGQKLSTGQHSPSTESSLNWSFSERSRFSVCRTR